MLNNQKAAPWKQLVTGEGEGKTGDKKLTENEDQPWDQKKEQKPKSNCSVGKVPSPDLVTERQSGGVRKEQEEKAKLQSQTKKTEGMASKQGHGDALQQTCVVPQMSASESRDVPDMPEPLRGKETQPLPQNVPGQNLKSKAQKEGRFSREQFRNGEAQSRTGTDAPRAQASREGAPGLCSGKVRCAVSSSDDSEEEDGVSSRPESPLLFDLPVDSQKRGNLYLSDQCVQRQIPAASGVSKKGESSDPAAQRANLITQLRQKKVSVGSTVILLLQKTPVRFPAPTSGDSKLPVNSTPGDLMPFSCLLGYLHLHVHTHTQTHTNTYN